LEDQEIRAAAISRLSKLPDWIAPLPTRIQDLRPKAGSRFEDDDRMKPTNPPSEQIVTLLQSSLDHFQALADAVGTSGLRPLASFTLIRSALEASALAAWLMLPGTKDARLRRSIRLSMENRRDTETYTKRFGTNAAISDWYSAEMTATKNSRAGTKSLDLNGAFPKLTSIIQETDKAQTFQGLKGVDVWRACSGIAHSNAQFHAVSVIQTAVGKMTEVSPNPAALLLMLEPAQHYLEFSLERAELYSAPTANKGPSSEANSFGR
jgi:hypothetical protein